MKGLISVAAILIAALLLSCKSDLDCTRYKTGKFFNYSTVTKGKIFIERSDSIQTETDSVRGFTYKYKINWQSPCDYSIIAVSNSKLVSDGIDSFFQITPIKVTIVNGNSNYYIYSASVDSADKHLGILDTIWVSK